MEQGVRNMLYEHDIRAYREMNIFALQERLSEG